MNANNLICDNDQRQDVLRQRNEELGEANRWNGIDYVDGRPVAAAIVERLLRQHGFEIDVPVVRIRFLCGVPAQIEKENLLLRGVPTGVSLGIAAICNFNDTVCVLAWGLVPGDRYRLDLVNLDHIDPRHSSFEFIVELGDVSLVDPKPHDECPPPRPKDPNINYLARDFESLRQVILDRLALIMPDWQERHVPDLGMTLVELLAYVGDQLSYYQDAVATEAYLGTARSRISVRRHARLVDYQLHEGCNARTFLHFEVSGNPILDASDVYFITKPTDKELAKKRIIGDFELEFEPPRSFESFEVISLPDDCPLIGLDDVKNWAGFMACLVDQSMDAGCPLGKVLFCKLPKNLRDELEEFAEHTTIDPPSQLVHKLREALDLILRQHCLWNECESLNANDRIQRMVAEFPRNGDPIACNRKCIEEAFPEFFAQTVHRDDEVRLYQGHNRIEFYTWDQTECRIPAGATSATLRDSLLNESEDIAPASVCCEFLQRHLRQRALQNLSPGDFLILEEVIGPKTGNAADADPAHRQVVRLSSVRFTFDPVPDPRTNEPRPIVEIEWNRKDALTFPLCVSATTSAPQCRLINNASIARGNVVLVDHGRTVKSPEAIGIVPHHDAAKATCCDDYCATGGECSSPPRPTVGWKAKLDEPELTFAEPVEDCKAATDILNQDVHRAQPQIELFGVPSRAASEPDGPAQPLFALNHVLDANLILSQLVSHTSAQSRWLSDAVTANSAAFLDSTRSTKLQMDMEIAAPFDRMASADDGCSSTNVAPEFSSSPEQQMRTLAVDLQGAVQWHPKPHLLDSNKEDQHFVVETDDQRRSEVRFGNNDLGRRPDPGTMFSAKYRTGSGPVGNVGAEKIRHVVFRNRAVSGIENVRNPIPARGGSLPETLEHARFHAPHAFRNPQRAIIANDYRDLIMRDFRDEVQQARATLHWTGSQTAVKVTVDPATNVRDIDVLLQRVRDRLHRYRRIGHCVDVQPPIYVPLDIEMTICVLSGYLRAHVQRELSQLFSHRVLPDGTKGFFHPDNLTFGDSIFLSRLVWTAKRVSGVENVTVDKLQRMNAGDQGELAAGVLTLAPLEIPLVRNDGSRPNCGQFCLNVRGER